ncbi:hypothetical protein ABK040_006885 [Willaertia magna]
MPQHIHLSRTVQNLSLSTFLNEIIFNENFTKKYHLQLNNTNFTILKQWHPINQPSITINNYNDFIQYLTQSIHLNNNNLENDNYENNKLKRIIKYNQELNISNILTFIGIPNNLNCELIEILEFDYLNRNIKLFLEIIIHQSILEKFTKTTCEWNIKEVLLSPTINTINNNLQQQQLTNLSINGKLICSFDYSSIFRTKIENYMLEMAKDGMNSWIEMIIKESQLLIINLINEQDNTTVVSNNTLNTAVSSSTVVVNSGNEDSDEVLSNVTTTSNVSNQNSSDYQSVHSYHDNIVSNVNNNSLLLPSNILDYSYNYVQLRNEILQIRNKMSEIELKMKQLQFVKEEFQLQFLLKKYFLRMNNYFLLLNKEKYKRKRNRVIIFGIILFILFLFFVKYYKNAFVKNIFKNILNFITTHFPIKLYK